MPAEFISILVLLTLSVATIWLCKKVHLPPILAYLVAGFIAGPSLLNLFAHSDELHVLAEIGIVFLLFSLGLEFSLPKLLAMRTYVLGVGSAQIILTAGLGYLVAWLLGFSQQAAFVIGGMIGLSSTAIVIKQTSEMGILNTPRSQLAVAILLFQDLAVVPFLIIIPLLNAQTESSIALSIAVSLGKGVLVVGLLLWFGKLVLPRIYSEVATTRTDELFVLTTIMVALLAAGLTYGMGLSLALGAFLAGMMLSESQYRYQIESDIRPFRDILMGLFFITVGMRLEWHYIWPNAHIIILITIAVIVIKTLLIRLSGRLFNTNAQDTWAAGIKLSQMGEFSFVLAALAVSESILSDQQAAILVSAGVLSMGLTPLLVERSQTIAKLLSKPASTSPETDLPTHVDALTQHVVILGFGRVGQSAAKMLNLENIPYIAIDADATRVTESLQAKEPIIFGDVSDLGILKAAHIEHALSVVVTFDQNEKALHCVSKVRQHYPNLAIIVRTKKDYDLEALYNAGATQVVPELQEGSLMLVSQIYHHCGLPITRILKRIQLERKLHYDHFHGVYPGETTQLDYENVEHLQFKHAVTISDDAWIVGRPLSDANFKMHLIKVHSIQRDGHVIHQPGHDAIIKKEDVIVISGKPRRVERAERKLLDG